MTVGGVLHAIVGSVEELGLATLVSVPLGVTAALFLAEIGGGLARVVRTIVEAMTALPDLVAGLFIYVTLILSLGFGKSGLCAAIAIGVTMMPIVARASEVVLRIVPGALREASYALGSSQWRTCWNVVLPTARSGLATAVVLAMARGIGETAPVLLVAGYTKEMNANPFSGPQTSLPLFIYNAVHIFGTQRLRRTRVRGGLRARRRRARAVHDRQADRRRGPGRADQATAPQAGQRGGGYMIHARRSRLLAARAGRHRHGGRLRPAARCSGFAGGERRGAKPEPVAERKPKPEP